MNIKKYDQTMGLHKIIFQILLQVCILMNTSQFSVTTDFSTRLLKPSKPLKFRERAYQ